MGKFQPGNASKLTKVYKGDMKGYNRMKNDCLKTEKKWRWIHSSSIYKIKLLIIQLKSFNINILINAFPPKLTLFAPNTQNCRIQDLEPD